MLKHFNNKFVHRFTLKATIEMDFPIKIYFLVIIMNVIKA